MGNAGWSHWLCFALWAGGLATRLAACGRVPVVDFRSQCAGQFADWVGDGGVLEPFAHRELEAFSGCGGLGRFYHLLEFFLRNPGPGATGGGPKGHGVCGLECGCRTPGGDAGFSVAAMMASWTNKY